MYGRISRTQVVGGRSVSFDVSYPQGAATVAQGQNATEFVGRRGELAELHEALDEARVKRGRVILVGGEPGIGKSRLVDELARHATQTDVTILWGRAWEDAGAPPYWPWVQALRGVVRASDADRLRGYLGPGAGDVVQLLPELTTVLPEVTPSAAPQSDSARFRLFDSTTSLLRAVAAERVVLLVLDDLHAADDASILLLRFVANELRDMSVLLVGTYRDLELTPDHPLTLAINDMARQRTTHLLMLGGLGSDDVSEYIAAATSVRPSDLTAAAVWRETNGNPLFMREAVRLLQAEGRLEDIADLASLRVAVPAGVRAVISRRIGHLTSDTREVLTTASVIGPEFGLDILRRVTAMPQTKLLDAITEANREGLLTNVPGNPNRYRFAHDLVRETIYDDLPASYRAEAHLRIAETIEQASPGPDDNLAELAFHFVHAAELGADNETYSTSTKAVEFATRAGDKATRSLAYEEARQLYAMALAVLDAGPVVDLWKRANLILSLGEANARIGNFDRARENFHEVARLARKLESGPLLARAALGYGGRHHWTRAGHDTLLIPLLRDALERLGTEDDWLRVRVLTRLAGASRGDPRMRAECDRLSDLAVNLARRLNDGVTLQHALTGRFWATWWPENPQARERIAAEIMSNALSSDDSEAIAEGQLILFLSVLERGDIHGARRQLDRLAEVVRRTRQPAHLWLEPTNEAQLALFQGDFARAETLIAGELRSTFRITPARDDVSAARMHLYLLRRDEGRLAEVEDTMRASVSEFPWYPLHRAALCLLLAELDRPDEATAVLNDLAENEFEGIFRDNEWLLAMALVSNAVAVLGDRDRAEVLYGQLLPYSGRHAIGHAEGSVGVVDHYLGLLAETMDRHDDAERFLNAAIDELTEQGGRPWAARARRELATVLRKRNASGDAARADELDQDAARDSAVDVTATANSDATPVASRTSRGAPDHARFEREGDVWIVEYAQDSFRVHDSKGMNHLARLLRSPGTELHALDMVHGETARSSSRGSDELSSGDLSDTGPLLDAAAKQAYRERLSAIGEELAEAERWNDPERAAQLELERSALVHELSAALGLGNRDRTSASSSSERARVSVTRSIRSAMDRIAGYSPDLGAHLAATIRTGTFCAYTPDPRAPIEWST
jgi:tetratricopeptide (TPR) repeat protein